MFRQSAAVILLVLTALACHADSTQADRPMCRLAGDRSPMASAIRRVLSVPGIRRSACDMTPEELGGAYLDMKASFGVKNEESFRVRAYEILDEVMSADRRLDGAWKSADQGNDYYRAAYCFLKYRLKFAEALAKAEISRRMAEPVSSSYCIQAMESAIDCLKASAEAREQFDKLREPQGYAKVTDLSPTTIREFRERLLTIWHSSKSRGSLAPIREIDISKTLNEALAKTVKDMKARKEIAGIFSWLGTSTSGNHSDVVSVE